MDLGGLWRGDFTPRRAASLAANLPAGSQVWVALDHDLAWTIGDYLTAVGVDRQRTNEKQKAIPRPADARDSAARIRAAEAQAARFEAQHNM